VGYYIWYSEKEPGLAGAPPSPLLAVPNVTAHPSSLASTASVPTSCHSMWHAQQTSLSEFQMNGCQSNLCRPDFGSISISTVTQHRAHRYDFLQNVIILAILQL